MASETHGSILLSTADSVSRMLMKKLDSQTGFKPSEWTDNINLLGALPIRTASGTIAHFEDGAEDVPLKSLTANIVPIQSGTGTPSPSNPRPISGTDELRLTKTDKNLLDYSSTITKEANTVTSTFIADLNFEAGLTYTISATQTPTAGSQTRNTFYLVTPSSTTAYGISDLSIRPMTYTATESGTFKLYLWNHTLDVDVTYSDFQVELGSTATTYEPYNAETYTFDLGQEIIGGTADVVGGSGTSDLKYLEIDGTEASLTLDSTPNVVRLTLSDLPSSNVSSQDYRYWGSESIYKYSATSNLNDNEVTMRTSGYLYYKNTNCTTLSDFQTFFATQKANGTPFAVCYELATPVEIQLTPEEINSYLGVNNLYTDSGEVLDVEYRADMNLLIAELEN